THLCDDARTRCVEPTAPTVPALRHAGCRGDRNSGGALARTDGSLSRPERLPAHGAPRVPPAPGGVDPAGSLFRNVAGAPRPATRSRRTLVLDWPSRHRADGRDA